MDETSSVGAVRGPWPLPVAIGTLVFTWIAVPLAVGAARFYGLSARGIENVALSGFILIWVSWVGSDHNWREVQRKWGLSPDVFSALRRTPAVLCFAAIFGMGDISWPWLPFACVGALGGFLWNKLSPVREWDDRKRAALIHLHVDIAACMVLAMVLQLKHIQVHVVWFGLAITAMLIDVLSTLNVRDAGAVGSAAAHFVDRPGFLNYLQALYYTGWSVIVGSFAYAFWLFIRTSQ